MRRESQLKTIRHRQHARRRGASWSAMIVGLVLVSAAGAGGWYALRQNVWSPTTAKPLVHRVARGLFSHVVTEQGEIESSSNIEVRCEVQSKNTAGTAILEIVPEGTLVKKGDLIAKLDESAMQNELSQQRITCNASEATVIKARSTVETARIAKDEYLNGTFRQEEQTIQAEISVAEENLNRAQDYFQYSQKLATKGYVTPLQLEADEFAVEKAKMDLGASKTKIEVLRKYTQAKMLSQLDADIRAAEATLRSEESTHQQNLENLALIETQIGKCTILAPADGQVVYANQTDRRSGGNEVIIDAGVLVRERQTIVRLPDPAKMQVKAKINESRIDRVHEGMQATIRLDAFPEEELSGSVTRVDEYPMAGNFWSNVKEYATFVQIDRAPPGRLRPGMTAQVQIYVEQIADALQVPVQSVFEHGGLHYGLVYQGGKLSAREVQIGSTNDKFVVIKSGLAADDEVALEPRKFLDNVTLPKIREIEEKRLLASHPAAGKDTAGDSAAGRTTEQGDAAKDAGRPSGGASVGANETTGREQGNRDATSSSNRNKTEAGEDKEGSAATAGEGDKPRRRRGGAGGLGGGGGNPFANMDPAAMAGMFIQQSDKDGDGKLSEEEYPEQFRSRFAQSDTNGDKFVDTQEITVSLRQMQARMRAAGGMPGAPGAGGMGGGGAPPAGGGGR